MEYRYMLAPYSGKGSRLLCPQCRQRELVPYIDAQTGEILDETCGKCNRMSHCGYHKTPSQFFQENPGARPQGESWREAPAWLNQKEKPKQYLPLKPKNEGFICELPRELVERSYQWAMGSNFVKFLDTILDPLIVEGLVFLYKLGGTKDGAIIYYQIDREGRIRAGKIMPYNATTGKRVKENTPYKVNWLHYILIKKKHLPEDWTLSQCVFGEHLLDMYPDQPVILVESEKSAIIGAGFFPEYIWLATGGKTQLGDKLNVLKGRKVIAFPDIDAMTEWQDYFNEHYDLGVSVENIYDGIATPEDYANQIDVADLLIRWKADSDAKNVPTVPYQPGTGHPAEQYRSAVTQQVAKYFTAEYLPEVDALIADLDLVPESVQKLPDNEDIS